jgi:predicted PurR-regulated permease PerM
MIDFIPYFGAFITLLFSVAFAYAVGGGFDKQE